MIWKGNLCTRQLAAGLIRMAAAVAAVYILRALAPVCEAVEAANTATEVKIATWNLRWFPAGVPQTQPAKDEYRRTSSVGRFIAWQKPDILMVQEMRDAASCSNLIEQVKDPKFKLAVCTQFPTADDAAVPTHQLAIFSKYPVLDSGWGNWTRENGITPPRGYAYAVLDAGGEPVVCLTVHLKSNFIPDDEPDPEGAPARNAKMREISARQAAEKAIELAAKKYLGQSSRAIVVAGDFNTSIFDDRFKDEKTIKAILDAGFKDAFSGVSLENRETMPATKYHGSSVFDYILLKTSFPVNTPFVAPRQWTSDHRMTTVKLSIPGNKSAE